MAQTQQDTGSRVIELKINSQRLKLIFLSIPFELGAILLLYKVLTMDREGIVPLIFLLVAVGLVVFATGMLVLGFVSGWIVCALLPRKGYRADALDRPTGRHSVRQKREREPDKKQD